MKKKRILFLCIHNSARSQMAEAFLNKHGNKRYHVQSAGLEAGTLNPVVVEAMQEVGIDISGNRSKDVREYLDRGETFDIVVTVCDAGNAARCPIFPGNTQRLHWGFNDPSGLTGTHEEKLQQTRTIRDQIETKILAWLQETESET